MTTSDASPTCASSASPAAASTVHTVNLQLRVLKSIASDRFLFDVLILRGAGALQLFYEGPRETRDLDFLVLNLPGMDGAVTPEWVKPRLNALLNRELPRQFGGKERWEEWLANVHIDLSPCLSVCECRPVNLAGQGEQPRMIKVCTLEEIVAEKLVAMLSAGAAEKKREQDLFDVAAAIARPYAKNLDGTRVAELGRRKAFDRGCRFELAQFDQAVRQRLSVNYPAIAAQTGDAFIPFDQAWARVLAFMQSLH